MFVRLGKVRAFCVGAVVLGTLLTPAMAADYRGQGGHVFYRGQHGAPQAFQSGGFGRGIADRRNFGFRGQFLRQEAGRNRFDHHGVGNVGDIRGMTAQNDIRYRHRGNGFDRSDANGRSHANHLPILASGDFSTRRGSGISVINRSQPDYDSISNHAGSVDVYHANGGTYISGYGDGGDGYQRQSSQPMRPRAKIVDVARMHSNCAYENGVCVIRP